MTTKIQNKVDAVGLLSSISGLSKDDTRKIFEEVRANSAILDSCQRHRFEVFTKYESGMVKKYKCSACGGTVDSLAKNWYERGIAHGKV